MQLLGRFLGDGNSGGTFLPIKKQSKVLRSTLSYQTSRILSGGGRNLLAAVRLPDDTERSDWLTMKTIDLFNELSQLWGLVVDSAKAKFQNPGDGFPPGFEYRWSVPGKKPMRVSSPEYIEYVMTWVEASLDNPSIFPTQDDQPFPEDFESYVTDITRRMFRVFAIMFHRCFEEFEKKGAQAHINTVFKHFMFFCFEFNLIDDKETAALKSPVENLKLEYDAGASIGEQFSYAPAEVNHEVRMVPIVEEVPAAETFDVKDTYFFLSHFKEEAAAEALLLLQNLCRELDVPEGLGFIDTNNLQNLGQLEKHVMATSAVVLIQTENVLFRPFVIVELITALDNGIPIVCVRLENKGYDFEKISKILRDPPAMRDLVGAAGVRQLEAIKGFDAICEQLASFIPLILSLPFSSAAPQQTRIGMIRDIANRIQERAVKSPKMIFSSVTMGEQAISTAKVHQQRMSRRVALPGHSDSVTTLDFSADSKYIASGSSDTQLRVWDYDGKSQERILCGHKNAVTSVSFDKSGSMLLASGSHDGTVKIWRPMISETVLKSFAVQAVIRCVQFNSTGQWLASGGDDGNVRIYVKTPSWNERTKWVAHEGRTVFSLCFSPASDILVTGGSDSLIKVWNPDDGSLLRILTGHSAVVTSIAFSGDSRLFASASHDRTIKLWETDRYSLSSTKIGHTDHVTGVAFSSDGSFLVSSSKDKEVKCWLLTGKADTCMVVRTLARIGRCVAIPPNQKLIAAGAADHCIHLLYF